MASQFDKLIPFARKSGTAVTGRERLLRLRKKLEFLLLTEDISESSRLEIEGAFRCPIVMFLRSRDVERLLGFRGTKVVGFRKSSLSRSLLRACREAMKEAQTHEAPREEES